VSPRAEPLLRRKTEQPEIRMNRRRVKYLLALCLLAAFTSATAQETVTRKYPLANHGYLQLQVPRSWQEELRKPSGNYPPTIVFTPKAGNSFQILITPVFAMSEGMTMPSSAQIKASVRRAAERAKNQAVEKTVPVKELKGPSAMGYYFSVTDRAPRPEEYKYMTQGILQVGAVTPTFTILTNDETEGIVIQSLSMLEGARHVDKSH
jgi:hypothetical protein